MRYLARSSGIWTLVGGCCFGLLISMADQATAQPDSPPAVDAVPSTLAEAIPDPNRDLVVNRIQEAPPTTLAERLRSVQQLLNVRAYTLANEYLTAALTDEADDEDLAKVQRTIGTAFFVRMLRIPEVREAGNKVARRVFDASDRIASNPTTIAKSIKDCTNDDLDTRREARSALAQIGAPAVPGLLTALTKEEAIKSETITRRLRTGIVEIGKPSVPVLIGALYSEREDLVRHARDLLGYMEIPEAQAHLAATGNLGSPAENQTRLIRKAIDDLLCEPESVTRDEFDLKSAWIYNDELKQLVRRTRSTTQHNAYTAALLARGLYLSYPDDDVHRQLFLSATLGWSKLEAGVDGDLPDLLPDYLSAGGPEVTDTELDAALLIACRGRQIPTALAAIQMLALHGDPTVIQSNGYKGLTAAIRNPDPRIRFYAAKTIVEIDPRSQYAAAADVANALSFAAAAKGRQQALIVHPAPNQAEYLAGLLRGLRFEVTRVANGREALRYARTHPDLELIIVSELIKRPSWNEITQRLSKDYHSGNVPITVLVDESKRPMVEALLDRFPRATAFPTPAGRTEMVTLVREAMARAGQFTMSPDQRITYAASALQTMQPLLQHRIAYAFYEWDGYESQLVESITVRNLAVPAARILGDLATPAAQSQLIDFASQVGRPVAAREAAAEAFAKAVERSGVLLTKDQISQQYRRYNDNLNGGDESAAVFSSLLDTIEKPSRVP